MANTSGAFPVASHGGQTQAGGGSAPERPGVPSTSRRAHSAAPRRSSKATTQDTQSSTPRRPESARSSRAPSLSVPKPSGPPPVPSRRAPSGCVPRPEKVVPKPPISLRAIFLRDGDNALVDAQLRKVAAVVDIQDVQDGAVCMPTAWPSPAGQPVEGETAVVALDVGGASPCDVVKQYCLQFRCVACDEHGEEAAAAWEFIDATPVEIRGMWCLALQLPVVGPCLVQTRLAQRQVPDSLSAWSDWARNARKESGAWLCRQHPPVLVGLPQPCAPNAKLEVSSPDGVSLAVSLRWVVSSQSRAAIGELLIWQYSWLPIFEDAEVRDACGEPEVVTGAAVYGDSHALSCATDYGQVARDRVERRKPGWTAGPAHYASLPADGVCESQQLKQRWGASKVIFRVRYRGERSIAWSEWSGPGGMVSLKLAPPTPARKGNALRVALRVGDPTAADLSWDVFAPSNPKVFAMQYKVEIRVRLTCTNPSAMEGPTGIRPDLPESADLAHQEEDHHSTEQSWTHVCTLEQRTDSAGAAILSCPVHGLRSSAKYTARVSARHWRIDIDYTNCLDCDFTVPSFGTANGVQPLRRVPDFRLPLKYRETATDWFAFWLPALVAEWHAPAVSLEWMHNGRSSNTVVEEGVLEAPAENLWELAAQVERASLRNVDAEGALMHGCAICVQLPLGPGELLLRCRHGAGFLCSAERLVPFFDPPTGPVAELVIDDTGVEVSLATQLTGRGRCSVTRCQFGFSAAGDGSSVVPWRELPSVAVLCPDVSGVANQIVRGSVRFEDPGLSLQRCRQHVFVARVGDDYRWSQWSEASVALVCSVPAPQPPHVGTIRLRELSTFSGVEVEWDSFLPTPGLSRVDYHVSVAPTVSLEDVGVQLLPGCLAESNGVCTTTLRRLVPATEYAITIHASCPSLCDFSEQEAILTTNFTTAAIDCPAIRRPAPPVQCGPPATRGGVDRRMPWSWDFWLGVDARAFESAATPNRLGYQLQWRSVDDIMAREETWFPVNVDCANADVAGVEDEHSVMESMPRTCHWDFLAAQKICCQPTPGVVQAMPEVIELRLRLEHEFQRIGVTPAVWHSCSSERFATAFAAPPKPRAALEVTGPNCLDIAVTFILCDELPGKRAPLPETWRTTAANSEDNTPAPAGVPAVPDGFGHRFVTRYQLRYRVAGDQNIGKSRELPSRMLDRSDLLCAGFDEENFPPGWCVANASVRAQSPEFAVGDKYVFSVRVGDDWRWSAWSLFSKPFVLDLPSIEVQPSAPIGAGKLSVEFYPPCQALLRWPAVYTHLQVPIECVFYVVALSSDGQELKDGRQIVGFYTDHAFVCGDGPCEDAGAIQEAVRQLSVTMGQLQAGRSHAFILMVRPVFSLMGPVEYKEYSRTDPCVWPFQQAGDRTGTTNVFEAWDIPIPIPVPVPEDVESSSGRWRGRAVLFVWPKSIAFSEDPPLELQGCEDTTTSSSSWIPVPWSVIRVTEKPYIVAAPLPFAQGRFRWYSRDRRIAGPRSAICVASFEPPDEPHAEVFCTKAALRIHVCVSLRSGRKDLATICQVRCQQIRHCVADDGAVETRLADPLLLPPLSIHHHISAESSSTLEDMHFTFGEDDGLRLGQEYVFSARIGDLRRRSPWSLSSQPVTYTAPAPTVPHGNDNPLLVEALSCSSVRFWWREIRAPEALSPRSFRPVGTPHLEYRLDVSVCLDNGGLERQATLLLEDADDGTAPFEATAHNLLPGARYFAVLAVRYARIGGQQWCKTGLKASFETPIS